MSPIEPLRDRVSERWRYALVGGLLSAPLTAAGYWQSGSELSLAPVLAGGAVAGFLAKRATGSSHGVGLRAGLVGGLPALWVFSDLLAATSGLGGPAWFVIVGYAMAVGTVLVLSLLVLGTAALGGEVAGRVGGWLAGSGGRRRPPAARN